MTEQHPITPPEQLLRTWRERQFYAEENINVLLTAAYQAGADHELEACLDEIYKGVGLRIIDHGSHRELLCSDLRAARRPKPPSLKEQALIELGDVYNRDKIDDVTYDTIRKALEQLND